MFSSNLPLKVASFILLCTYCVFMSLMPIDTISVTIILVIFVSACIVLHAIIEKLLGRNQ